MKRSRHWATVAVAFLAATLSGTVAAGESNTSKKAAAEKTFEFNGFRAVLGKPRVVAEVSVGHCWYPDLLKFSTGELMLNHSLNADANANQHNSQAVYLSTDRGKTFEYVYDVNGFHNGGGEPRISLADGRIIGTSTFLKPYPPDQKRRYVAHRWTYDRGGKRYAVEPWGAVVEGLPKDVAQWPRKSRTWWSRINWFTDIVALENGELVCTLSLRFSRDRRESTVALGSKDNGRTWKYLSTIAGPNAVPDASEGFDEPCLVQLKTGELMCVSRVGSGQHQKLARAYSKDNGKTWSKVDRLPAFSVAPQICRTKNDTLVISTGRPGVFLWLSTDVRGEQWQSIDVMKHHNAMLGRSAGMTAAQTTAYTAMVEVAPNEILLVYDHTPNGWGPVTANSGKRSRIYLVNVRVIR